MRCISKKLWHPSPWRGTEGETFSALALAYLPVLERVLPELEF